MKNCLMCGKPFTGKREDSKFCSSSCKAKHWEIRKSGALKGLSGVSPFHIISDKIIPPKMEAKPAEQFLSPLSNVLNDTAENKEVEIVLPEQYITKALKEDNPAYKQIEMNLSECKKNIKACEEEIQGLNRLIEEQKSKDGTFATLAGTGSGAILGYNLGTPQVKIVPLPDKNSKNKKGKSRFKSVQQKGTDNRFLYTVIGGLLGLGLGKAINAATEDSREKLKVQSIKKYSQQRYEVQERLKGLRGQESKLLLEIFKTVKYTSREVKMLNPSYMLALDQQKKRKQLEAEKEQNNILKGLTQGTDEYANGKIIPMQKVAEIKHRLLNFKDKWRDFFGLPQTNFFCVIHGMSGEGKSTFAMQFAKYLAEQFGMVLFVSGEEGFASTFQSKVQEFKTDIPAMYAGDIRTGEELLKETPTNKFHFIIIDSLNNMGIDPDMMKKIRAKFKNSAIIAICQSTKDGKVRGSYEMIHDSDIAVKVTNGIAITTKNRFKEKNMEFDVFETMRKKERPIIPIYRKLKDEDSGMDSDLRNTI